jgi:hypothetical protein
MKKRLFTFIAVASVAFLTVVGCSNSNIDTAKVRAALQSVEPAQKELLEQSLTAIDAGKYKDAYPPLRKFAFSTKLTVDQNKIIKDTMARLQAKIAKGQ